MYKHIVLWRGLPACGLLLSEVTKVFKDDLLVLSTDCSLEGHYISSYFESPHVKVQRYIDIFNLDIITDSLESITVTGWHEYYFLLKLKYLSQIHKFKINIFVDNIPKKSIKQFFSVFLFKFVYNPLIDNYFVPGNLSRNLLLSFGVSHSNIYINSYGAFEKIYFTDISIKKNGFLYVGQLIDRKNVKLLCNSFREYKIKGGKESLTIVGDGYLRDQLIEEFSDIIIFLPYSNPNFVSDIMRESKCLILLSKEEHWGTVVAEALACGCGTILVNNIGCIPDLFRGKLMQKSIFIEPKSSQVVQSMFEFENYNPHVDIINVHNSSSINFTESFIKMISK
jgi:glycosyltransferase involved in cell wall biosynthesis